MALNAGEPTTPPQSTTATQSTTPWVFVTPPASTTSPLSPFPSLIITPPVSTAPQWPLVVPSSSVVRKPGITSSLAIDDPHFVPLTCHGHSRPVTHISFGHIVDDGYYLVSACKGKLSTAATIATDTDGNQMDILCCGTVSRATGKIVAFGKQSYQD